jgi:hypothetical protein
MDAVVTVSSLLASFTDRMLSEATDTEANGQRRRGGESSGRRCGAAAVSRCHRTNSIDAQHTALGRSLRSCRCHRHRRCEALQSVSSV